MVKKAARSLKYVYLALMILFLYIPILYLIVFSFNDFSTGRRISYANLGAWKGFTLHNYTTLFTVGVCFREQFYLDIPTEPHDIPMHKVIVC